LDPKSNEFDIVAIYRDACPKIVFENRLVPYDSVAFLVEVKKTLSLPFITKDLEKFEKLNNVRVSYRHAESEMDRPLRVLFYCESEIDSKELKRVLTEKEQSWDLCTILDKGIIAANKNLPFNKQVLGRTQHVFEGRNPLVKMMFFATTSTTKDISKGWMLYWNLFRSTAPHGRNLLIKGSSSKNLQRKTQ
jgi:hypothetical protein